jgi:hypothetical protein
MTTNLCNAEQLSPSLIARPFSAERHLKADAHTPRFTTPRVDVIDTNMIFTELKLSATETRRDHVGDAVSSSLPLS